MNTQTATRSLPVQLIGEYARYLSFAHAVGWTPYMPFEEWYEQRDHEEDEPEVEPRTIIRNETHPPQMYPSTCPPTKEAWLPEPCEYELYHSHRCGQPAVTTVALWHDHHTVERHLCAKHAARYC